MNARANIEPMDNILRLLEKVKKSGNGWVACCPAHPDKNPSLGLNQGADGRVLIKCWAGCESRDVMAAIGLGMKDLYGDSLSYTDKLRYERESLVAARDHACIVRNIAVNQAQSVDPDFEDLLFAAANEVELPKILDRIEQINSVLDANPEKVASHLAELFQTPSRDFVVLPESIRQTVIGKMAQRVAHCMEFPEASATLALLGTSSAAVATSYAVQYKTGTPIPCGLNVTIEQPPATQKTSVLDVGLNPYMRGIIAHNKKVSAHNQDAEQRIQYAFVNSTDPTSAGLDQALADCSEGRFVVASAEQSAFASLFPTDAAYASNNELVLKGWAGEYVSGQRKGRKAFSGIASSTVVLVAQPGSAQRVFSASNGTGLAERFFYLSEPSFLGRRTLHGEYLTRHDKADFDRAILACVDQYSKRIFDHADADGAHIVQDPENLIQLKASPEGYAAILNYRRKQEPRLGELAGKGDLMLVSWLGKIETHTLKIAAVLHVIECLAAGCEVPDVIPATLIRSALDLAVLLGEHLEQLLHDSGESGEAAEVEAVINLLAEKPLSAEEAKQALKRRSPFRAMGAGSYKAASARLKSMLAKGLLVINTQGRLTNV